MRAGCELLARFAPDAIVAVGGGSVLDAAKAMRLFHESPELTVRELSLPFLDARKRVARYPQVDASRRASPPCPRPPAPARRSRRRP